MPDVTGPLPELEQLVNPIGDQRLHVTLSPDEALALLRSLASDDQFRAEMSRDPYGVLAGRHVYLPDGYLGERPHELPPKDAFAAFLADFQDGRINPKEFGSGTGYGRVLALAWLLLWSPARPAGPSS